MEVTDKTRADVKVKLIIQYVPFLNDCSIFYFLGNNIAF